MYARLGGVTAYVRDIWKSVAFLGRYGHQPVDVCLALPVSDIVMLSEEISQMIKDEGEAARIPHD